MCCNPHSSAEYFLDIYCPHPNLPNMPWETLFLFRRIYPEKFFWHVSSFVWEIIFGPNFTEEAENDGGEKKERQHLETVA